MGTMLPCGQQSIASAAITWETDRICIRNKEVLPSTSPCYSFRASNYSRCPGCRCRPCLSPDRHAIFARTGLWRGPLSALPLSAPLQLPAALPKLELVLLPEKDDGSLALSLARAQLSVPLLGDRAPTVTGSIICTPLANPITPAADTKVTPGVGNGGVVAPVDTIGADGDEGNLGVDHNSTDTSGPEGASSVRVVSITSEDGGDDLAHDSSSSGDNDGSSGVAPAPGVKAQDSSQEAHSAAPSLALPTSGNTAEGANSSQGAWGLAIDVVKILSEGGRPRNAEEQRELARDALQAGDGDRILLCLGRLEGEGPPVAGGRADRFDDPAAVAERARRRREEGEERKIGTTNVRNGAAVLVFGLLSRFLSQSWLMSHDES